MLNKEGTSGGINKTACIHTFKLKSKSYHNHSTLNYILNSESLKAVPCLELSLHFLTFLKFSIIFMFII
jgi:hypothetical protein